MYALGAMSASHTLLITDSPQSVETRLRFDPRPDYADGRTISANGVRFYDMHIEAEGDGEVLSTQPIAVKPLDTPQLVAHEYAMSNAVNNICPGATFEPIGFSADHTSKVSVVTKFEPGVRSFDNVFFTDVRPSEATVEWALGCAAASIIFLHANNVAHGDYALWNTAHSAAGDGRIIDLTSAKRESNPELLMADLDRYMQTFSFNGSSDYVSPGQLVDIFLTDYRDALKGIFPQTKLSDAKQRIRDLIKATRSAGQS